MTSEQPPLRSGWEFASNVPRESLGRASEFQRFDVQAYGDCHAVPAGSRRSLCGIEMATVNDGGEFPGALGGKCSECMEMAQAYRS